MGPWGPKPPPWYLRLQARLAGWPAYSLVIVYAILTAWKG